MNKIHLIIFLILISCQSKEKVDNENQSTHFVTTNSSINRDDSKINKNNLINKPVIDGFIRNKEWQKSKKYNFYGGDSIFFMKSDDTLFIAIKGQSGGFTSMGFSNGNQIKILHASTGLITAEYQKTNSNWQLLYGFKEPLKKTGVKFPRNNERLGEIYKESHMEQFGWYANLIEMGKPNETEFIIPISCLPEESLFFSVVFYQIKSEIKKARFPEHLYDGMLNQELISGSAVNELEFDVESWFSLKNIYTN